MGDSHPRCGPGSFGQRGPGRRVRDHRPRHLAVVSVQAVFATRSLSLAELRTEFNLATDILDCQTSGADLYALRHVGASVFFLSQRRSVEHQVFLEIFSGEGVLASAVAAWGYAALRIDIFVGDEYDVLRKAVEGLIVGWIRSECVFGVLARYRLPVLVSSALRLAWQKLVLSADSSAGHGY